MIISYDGPHDFEDQTIKIKIELQPSELPNVVARLLDTTLTPSTRVSVDQLGGVPLSAFTDGQLESIVRAVHIEQTARGRLRSISTQELVEKVRVAAHNSLLTLNDVRLIQDIAADWCRAHGFAVKPST